jgi:hypothetical protein
MADTVEEEKRLLNRVRRIMSAALRASRAFKTDLSPARLE